MQKPWIMAIVGLGQALILGHRGLADPVVMRDLIGHSACLLEFGDVGTGNEGLLAEQPQSHNT